MAKKIIIVGAGVIGVTSAYFLKRKGFDITVIDSNSQAGLGTSYGNGSQLSYSKTYPFSNPKTLRNLPKYIFGKNSPVHIKKPFDPAFIKWGMQFIAESSNKKARANNEQVFNLALESKQALAAIVQEHDIKFDFARLGKIYLYETAEAFEESKKFFELQNNLGLEYEVWNIEKAIEKEPALTDMRDKVKGIIYCPIDEAGDCKKFSDELMRVCESEGVKFLWNTQIDDFNSDRGVVKSVICGGQIFEADEFVVSSGVYTPKLLKKLGVDVPIYPMKGYSITVPATDKAPKINITDEGRRIVYAKIGDRLRVAGIAEFSGYDYTVRRKIMDKLIRDAAESFPQAADYSQVEEWTGLRPMTPSTVPIIGKNNKYSNLYINAGQGMLGWTLACGSGKKLADEIL